MTDHTNTERERDQLDMTDHTNTEREINQLITQTQKER